MTSTLQITPDREVTKSILAGAGAQLKAEVQEVRESSKSPIVSDIGSPYGSSGCSQYNGEYLDFGEADMGFI